MGQIVHKSEHICDYLDASAISYAARVLHHYDKTLTRLSVPI